MSSNKQYFEGESTSPHIIIANRSEKGSNDSIFTRAKPKSPLISEVFIDDLNSMDIISDSPQINSSSSSEIHIENLASFSVLIGNTPKYNFLSNDYPDDVSYFSNSQPENVIFDQLGSHHSLDKIEPSLQVNVDNFVTFPEQSNFDRAADVTHIEIIKPKQSASRRLTGANRVLPFITNMWQGGEQQVTEPTLAATYKAFFESLEYMDERKCEECQLELLSSTHLQYHLKEVHKRITVMLEQCFVCRKKYVCPQKLQFHLFSVHDIKCPDMICKVCFMECNTTIEQKAHERKHENIYSCHFCSSKFASEYHCQMHFNDHMKLIKPNECQYCGKRFYNETSLVIHMHHHLNVKCHICGLVFKDDIIFLKHMNGHGNKKLELFMKNVNKFDEDESNLEALLNFYNTRTNSVLLKTKYFNSDSDILDCVENMVSSISHVINLVPKHVSCSNKYDMSCHICKVGLETTKDLLEHYNKSHPRNRTCVFCGRRSKSVSMTRRHVVTHLKTEKINSGADTEDKNIVLNKTNGGNSLECIICLKKFATKGKRNYHMLLVHKVDTIPRPYSCAKCPRKFMHKKTFHRHLKYIHRIPSSKILDSDVCKKVLPNSEMLLEHSSKQKEVCLLQSATEINSQHSSTKRGHLNPSPSEDLYDRLECNICNKVYINKNALLKHKAQHEVERKCQVCNRSFTNLKKLKFHLKSHSQVKRYRCSKCSVSCENLSSIKIHNLVHTGERPFRCSECNRSFRRQTALKIHTRIVHQPRENVKHRCSLCVACFNTQGNLLRHFLSVHQELRRFICGLCGSRYSQNQVLRRHLLQVHQVQIDSISCFDKKSVSEVYILPSTNQFPISPTVAAKIRDIAEEEKQKFTGVKEFLKTCLGISNQRQNETFAEVDTQTGVAQVQTEEVTQVNKTCQTFDTQNDDTEELTTIQLPATNFALNTEQSCSNETQTNKLEESLCSSQTTGEGSVSHTLINEPSILTSEIFDIDTMFTNLEELAEPINNDIMSCEFCFRDKDSLTEHVSMNHMITAYRCGLCMADFLDSGQLVSHLIEHHEVTLQDVFGGNTHFYVNLNKNTSPTKISYSSQETRHTQTIKYWLRDFVCQRNITIYDKNIEYQESSEGSLLPSTVFNVIEDNSTKLVSFVLQPDTIVQSVPILLVDNDIFDTSQTSAIGSQLESDNEGMAVSAQSQGSIVPNDATMQFISVSDAHNTIFTDPVTDKNAISPPTITDWRSKPSCEMATSGVLPCKLYSMQVPANMCAKEHSDKKTGARLYTCKECSKCFTNKSNLNVHMRSHTGQRPYQCDQCGKSMRYYKEFVEHKRIHDGITPFECKDCGRKFRQRRVFVRHKEMHSLDKKHKCPVCNKAFSRLDVLKLTHMKTHIDHPPELHLCTVCNKGFTTKKNLHYHQALHSGIKKYICSICDKTFARRIYLNSHLKVHEKQEKYIQCPICTQKFPTKEKLKLHKKKFHEKKKRSKDQKPVSNNIATEEEPMFTLTDIDLQEVNFLCDDERYNTVTYLIPEMLEIM